MLAGHSTEECDNDDASMGDNSVSEFIFYIYTTNYSFILLAIFFFFFTSSQMKQFSNNEISNYYQIV